MKNCVTINIKKDEIIVKIIESADQKEVIECLKDKMSDLKKLYKDDKTPIYVVGKVLKNKEMDEIQDIIERAVDVKVNFETPKTLGLHGIKKSYNKEIASSDTKFHKGSLRSGQRVEYEGSIVIIGDVNAGAEIVAGDNVVILGTLRGLAHAGAKGNKQAIIAADEIDCAQIRISNIIKEIERNDDGIQICTTYAYVNDDDEIVLE